MRKSKPKTGSTWGLENWRRSSYLGASAHKITADNSETLTSISGRHLFPAPISQEQPQFYCNCSYSRGTLNNNTDLIPGRAPHSIMVRDAFAYQRRTNAGAKDPLYQARDTAMKELMSKRVGGQGTVRLAQLRAQDGGFLSRVNAYWTYTLFHVQGRPFPVWPLVWFMIYSVGVTLLVKLYMEPIGQLDNVKNLKPDPQGIASILGLAVFLILTFRNNSAYQRWYVSISVL